MPAESRAIASLPAPERAIEPLLSQPVMSVIVLNYNGARWLERCLESLRAQTIAKNIEVIVADNASNDQSDRLAMELMRDQPNWRVLQHGYNFGFSEGNNRAVATALGRYVLFLNADTWLEPDCLERLAAEVQAVGAAVATPLVLGYLDNEMQSAGESGFDIFGMLSGSATKLPEREIFVAAGPALLVGAEWFERVGGFDPEFFMYGDEFDICWRIWLAGGKAILAKSARLHHRGAVGVNPRGDEEIIEVRTSDSKRFFANRNNLLTWLKNSQHLLLAFLPLQLGLLAAEAAVMAVLTRRWSHAKCSYWDAVVDCWKLRKHIGAERRKIKKLRRHGDFWMLRFLRWRLNRWREMQRFLRAGLPKVDAK